jgi:hypothetical protein
MMRRGIDGSFHLRPSGFPWMERSSMKTLLSWIRRFLFPAVTAVFGALMLVIPWVLPFGRVPGRMAVFMVAGIVELVLGVALAYLVLHDAG